MAAATKHDVQYLIGALRTVAGEAERRGLNDLQSIAQAGLDLYERGPQKCAEERGETAER